MNISSRASGRGARRCAVAAAVALVAPLAMGPGVSQAATDPGVGQIATFAGGIGSGNPATIAQQPGDVAVSGSKIYVSDADLHAVRVLDTSTGQEGVVAGNGTIGYSGDGRPAPFSQLYLSGFPTLTDGVTTDSAGDLFVADKGSNVIREVAGTSGTQFGIAMTAGDIYTVAGNGKRGYSGNGGPATKAELNGPSGVGLDHSGDLFIADSRNNVIREVAAATDDISTFAGNGTAGYAGDGGSPTAAQLNLPSYVIVDEVGDVLISDSNNNVIREVPAAMGTQFGVVMTAGDIYTIAGNHTAGYSGDGGAATKAELHFPGGITLDGSGNVIIADTDNVVVREVTATGVISTIAGNRTKPGYSGDGGPATQAGLFLPVGVAIDTSGDLFVADRFNNRVREVAGTSGTQFGQAMTAGDIYTVAGNGQQGYQFAGDGGPATAGEFVGPNGVAVDSSGDVFVADTGGARVREIPATSGPHFGQAMTAGDLYTIAGNGGAGDTGDGGPAAMAEFERPLGLSVDSEGDVIVADEQANVVREIAAVSGTHFGQAMTAGDIYTIAGDEIFGASGDGGPATSAELGFPTHVAVDSAGDVLIADSGTNRVREVAAAPGSHFGVAMSAGDIYTVAGNGTGGYFGDGGPATSAELNAPTGVALDPMGDLVIVDSRNEVIREVAAQSGTNFGVAMAADDIYTVAGDGTYGFSGNGGPATMANMELGTQGVAVDQGGNLLFPDAHRIVQVAAHSGTNFGIAMTADDIYTVAGNGSLGFSGEGGPATMAGVTPLDVALEPTGDLLIVDYYSARVLEVGADKDLALATPPDVTVPATSPSGAVVTYTAPAVSDPDDASAPAPTCSPASGSTFKIGTTTVTCSVTDADDIPATMTTTFTVTVQGAAAQLADLYQAAVGVGPGTSLADKVQAAQSYLAAGDTADACSTLAAFINEVKADSGRSVPTATAAQLIADAERIRSVLAC